MMHWSPNPLNPDRNKQIYSDTYMSEVMIQAQAEVDNLPLLEGDTKECVVQGLMLASDCTQLTNFGSASVWPIYMMFANQPKEERVRPSCHTVHHLAYAPSVSLCQSTYTFHLRFVQLSQDFVTQYQEKTGQAPKPAAKVHCKRKLMHAAWSHIMDEDFIEACMQGLTINSINGIKQVFFVCIITYSADYPEK
jgi:hypothetical protein